MRSQITIRDGRSVLVAETMEDGRMISGRIPMLPSTGSAPSPTGAHGKIPMMGAPSNGIQERLVGRPRQPAMPKVALGPGGRIIGDVTPRQEAFSQPVPAPGVTSSDQRGGGVVGGLSGGIQERMHWRPGIGLAARSSSTAVHT